MTTITPDSHVFMVPTQKFVGELYKFLDFTGITPVNPESLCCSVVVGKIPLTGLTLIKSPVVAKITGADRVYDDVTDTTDLSIFLNAPSITKRREEIVKLYGSNNFIRLPDQLQLVISYNLPPKHLRIRHAIASLQSAITQFFLGTQIELLGEQLGSVSDYTKAKMQIENQKLDVKSL